MNNLLDPMALANFMAMENAARLVTAFASIPEGPLRDSIVAMAEQVAAAHAPAAWVRPAEAAKAAPKLAALPAPTRAPTDDPAVKAVALMMEGSTPLQASEATGLSMKAVHDARRAAKRQGMRFPKVLMNAKVKPDNVVKLKPKAKAKAKAPVFYTTEEELTERMRAGAKASANVLKLTVPEFLAKRVAALAEFRQGTPPRAVATHLGLPQKMVENWLTICRATGLVERAVAQATV